MILKELQPFCIYDDPAYPIPYNTLRKKCPYLELFWSAFSRIRTEYGEIRNISPYSVRMRENTEQNNSEYGHFLSSKIDQET